VKGVVLRVRVRLWCRVAWFAARWCLPFGVLVDHLAHQPQHAPYDISYYHFAWLRRCQPPADLLYALNELGSVPSLELADYAQKQSRCGNSAWSRIPYLSSFEKSGAGLSVVAALLHGGNICRTVFESRKISNGIWQ
jgi:hypothetical protein